MKCDNAVAFFCSHLLFIFACGQMHYTHWHADCVATLFTHTHCCMVHIFTRLRGILITVFSRARHSLWYLFEYNISDRAITLLSYNY